MYKKYLLLLISVTTLIVANGGAVPTVVVGEDWSFPASVQQAPNSGLYSEEASPNYNVNLKVFDVAWKQINPSQGVYATNIQATVKDMPFATFASQNASTSPFWMRIWNSGDLWAPSYVKTLCNVGVIGKDYDGEGHLPIWNTCVWNEIKAMYRYFFLTKNMRADPRLKFIQIPGAFNWCEFDFDVIGNYSTSTGYTFAQFNTWFQTAMDDLVYIFNGENNDPTDDYAYKLIYTGEDYPFDVDSWPAAKNKLASDAVNRGMGIRTGITEVSNFHLSNIPAYGYLIDSNGYMVLNKSSILQNNPKRVIATENECYNACGYKVPAANIFYAVKMSNLKALQMGVNWLYVVNNDSYLKQYTAHWNWVRLSLGRYPNTAFDAWVALRDAQDKFSYGFSWTGAPYVKNYERFLTQRDVVGAVTKRGTTKYTNVVESNNGIAYEGRQTDIPNNPSIVFYLDDQFIVPTSNISTPVQVKVTYLDNQATSWILQYTNTAGVLVSSDPVVQQGTSKALTTATFTLTDALFQNNVQPGNSDFKITTTGSQNIEIWFVRVIKQ
ncbi:hypothetical protein PPL_02193 [Heterostelium album PN500]|uniref:Uncharacterized protein n=1 Tax=Heterostelium pallidum (strain ATCC 26659 / Pp 5 / PN500) TaxID=670386 RepID=D3B1L9_HETP5|nr:hypothetical protein PPL_02193 [Heterostelium album PN500]EFA85193.1 hypothetical protein PPL_02193 [Heterostelium album PN500]|eukprot:XP_020437302.1 hypothetical protein PPL_02193 [Heterostelium album PN500]